MAIAEVAEGEVVRWQAHLFGWDVLHDEGTEGSHHAGVATFLRDHQVDAVLAHHMGAGMAHMLERMGVQVHLGAAGPAREAVGAIAREHRRGLDRRRGGPLLRAVLVGG